MTVVSTSHKGASWLLEATESSSTFTPEKLSDEHRLMAQTVEEFVEKRSAAEDRPARDEGLDARARPRCAAPASSVSSASAFPRSTAASISTRCPRSSSRNASRALRRSAPPTVPRRISCIIPIVLFGTDAQKAKYLPGLVAGETIGAYALERIGLGIRRARGPNARDKAGRRQLGPQRREDVDHQRRLRRHLHRLRARPTAISSPPSSSSARSGVKSGNEEHKMGLHGSSTTPILLQDVKVPADEPAGRDRQGAQGRAQHAELRPLQAGRDVQRRMSRGDRRGGASTRSSASSSAMPIADFGAIKHKLGEMTARTYALESLMYRTAGLIDAAVADGGSHGGPAIARGAGGIRGRSVDREGRAAAKCSTTCSTRTCRFTAATGS